LTDVDLSVFGGQPDLGSLSEEARREVVKRIISSATPEQKMALAGLFMRKQAESAEPTIIAEMPQTPDALWDYVNDIWGVKVARVSVCDGHDTPFDFLCAGYFETYPNIFGIGPRSGGKSFLMALLHELNSRSKPGCQSSTFGAVDEQSKKVYQDMVSVFLNGGLGEGESEVAGEPTQLKTIFKNGSEVNCFPGTVNKVNGPHPCKVHSDEVELMREDVWRESRNLAADKITQDGRVIKAQNYGTSTRKWKNGRVDKIYQEFAKAKEAALKKFGKLDDRAKTMIVDTSKFYVMMWCIFEVAQQVPNCRCVPENQDLPEYDYDHEDTSRKCGCHTISNGTWDKEGKVPRTLESVCKGRLYRSRGHRSFREVRQLFTQNDRATWEAQQECIEAEATGLLVPSFSRRRHGLQFFPIDPANGPFYTAVDWGTIHQACVLWAQYLERDVVAVGYEGGEKILPKGSRVVFAEIYESGMTSAELGEKVIAKEFAMAQPTSFDRIPVRKRWADVQGTGDRRVWRKMGLPTAKYSTRNVSEQVKTVRGYYEVDRAFVVVPQCPRYCEEMETWREDEKGDIVDDKLKHAMAAGRYLFLGMRDVYNDEGPLAPERPDGDPAPLKMKLAGGLSAMSTIVDDGRDLDLEAESGWMAGAV
jgi:hypothetical protein